MFPRRYLILGLIIILIYTLMTWTSFGRLILDNVRNRLVDIVHVGQVARVGIIGSENAVAECFVDDAQFKDLSNELASLRQLFGFVERSQTSGLGADVIARSYDPIRSHVIVNQGSTQGVEVGASVVAGEGVFIGVVEEVMPERSVIRLLLDPKSRVAGRLLNVQQSEGVVVGGHGIVVRMELIPRDEEIPMASALVTSGLDDHVPRGLLVGHVIAVEPDTNSLFNRAIIETPIDYQKITQVFILTPAL